MNENILTHNSEVLMKAMKDLDLMIERTIANMTNRNAEDATMTMKISIHLEKKSVPDIGGIREITQPSFKHDISSVMQVKDKMSGAFKGNVELTFDEQGRPVVRDVNDGQVSIFDEGGRVVVDYDTAVDADVQSMLGGGQMKGLPEAPISEDTEAASPYEHLMTFRNMDLEVRQNAEHFDVFTADTDVIIAGSSFDKDSGYYIDPWKLQKHVGHNLVCITSPENASDNEIEAIEIWCDEDGEMLLSIPKPAADEDAADEAPDDSDGDYSYDEPEEG